MAAQLRQCPPEADMNAVVKQPEASAPHAGFPAEVEAIVRAANQAVIHDGLRRLDRDAVTRLAVAVAKLRTRYLQAALGLIGHEDGVPPDYADISSVTRARVMYEEAMHAFNAVTRAIERG